MITSRQFFDYLKRLGAELDVIVHDHLIVTGESYAAV